MSMKRKFLFLSVLFGLSFMSFILGWLFAVSVFPGRIPELSLPPGGGNQFKGFPTSPQETPSSSIDQKASPNKASQKEAGSKKEPFINSSLFKEMRDSVLLLFNPYAIGGLDKKDTILNDSSPYIHKSKKTVQLKADLKSVPESDLESDKKSLSASLSSSTSPQALLKKTDSALVSAPNKSKTKLSQPELLRPKKSDSFLKQKISALEASFNSIQFKPFVPKIQQVYDEKNKEQLLSIEKQQDFFKSNGKFSFLVNVFSEEDKALEYIKKIKEEYPLWSFLLKAHGDHIRIYLGPFTSKKSADSFKKGLPVPYPFPSLEYLEEVGL